MDKTVFVEFQERGMEIRSLKQKLYEQEKEFLSRIDILVNHDIAGYREGVAELEAKLAEANNNYEILAAEYKELKGQVE